MSHVRAILVDLDGTLVETGDANFAAYAEALLEQGMEVSRGAFDLCAVGRNWRQFLPQLIEMHGVCVDPSQVARRKAELYPGHYASMILNEALVELLRLQKPNCRMGLVTTASATNAWGILRYFSLTPIFDVVVTGDDVNRHKPAPDAYVLAAERLSCLPSECVVIEDSDVGIAAAAAFGAPILRVQITSTYPSPSTKCPSFGLADLAIVPTGPCWSVGYSEGAS